MSLQHLVSIMMPAYNAEDTIIRALKSLKLQTYNNWECIVVDDGSTDNTSNLVKSIEDSRVKLITLQENMGRGYARQTALDFCNGDFIAMLDADDWYYPNKLEKQINAFKMFPEVDVVSCLMASVDKKGVVFGIRGEANIEPCTFSKPTSVPMPHASTIMRKKAIKKHAYDSSLKYGQDMDFLRRVLLGRKYLVLDIVGYVYEEGYSNRFSKSFKSYFYSAKAYSKFFNDYPLFIGTKITFEVVKSFRLLTYTSIGRYDQFIKKRSKKIKRNQIEEYYNNLGKLQL